jgi:hypothetical protein
MTFGVTTANVLKAVNSRQDSGMDRNGKLVVSMACFLGCGIDFAPVVLIVSEFAYNIGNWDVEPVYAAIFGEVEVEYERHVTPPIRRWCNSCLQRLNWPKTEARLT